MAALIGGPSPEINKALKSKKSLTVRCQIDS